MKQKIEEISTAMIAIILILMPIAILPFNNSHYNDLRKIILLVCGAVLFITFLLKLPKIKFNIEDIAILIFSVLAIISTVFSLNVKQSIFGAQNRYEGILSILIYILIYFHAKNSFKEFHGFRVMLLTAYIGIFCVAILQFYMPSSISSIPMFGKGAHGTIGHTNFMGSFVSILLPAFILSYIIKGSKKYLVFSLFSFSVMIMCIARSSWVAFICYMIIISIYLIIRKNKNYWKKFGIEILTFIIIFIFIMLTQRNNVVLSKVSKIENDLEIIKDSVLTNEELTNNELTNNELTNKIGSYRIEIWKMTAKVIYKTPFIGCGVDALEYGLEKFAPEENINYIFATNNYVDKAHNEYLQIAATMGIPALVVYLIFLGAIIIPNIKNVFKSEKIMIALTIIASYLIQAFFNISVISVAPLFWFTLGITSRYKNELK